MLNYDKSIVLTADILKYNTSGETSTIRMSNEPSNIEVIAKDILFESNGSPRNPESIVYGESLVELLKWMITTLMNHKHPPNAAPIPDFFQEANNRMRNLEVDLLNKRIRTK